MAGCAVCGAARRVRSSTPWSPGATLLAAASGREGEGRTELGEMARTIIESNRYMVLGTADAEGVPWVTPLW